MTFVRSPKDFWAGVLFIVFGLLAILVARDYPLGTAARMGPGYFPRGLGILMIALGLILALRALRISGTRIHFGSPKPLLIVLGSVIMFALAAPKLGLVVATVLLILASSTADKEYRWKESAIASVILAMFTIAAFSWGLKLQLPIWPAFFG
jgi:Tripartite tricarboxylate transporter TctB family